MDSATTSAMIRFSPAPWLHRPSLATRRQPARCRPLALALSAAALVLPAAAQTRLDEPPRAERAPAAAVTAPTPGTPGSTASVTPAPTGVAVPEGAARGAAPESADWPLARETAATTTIEQRRVGNRVVEIIVTPAGSTRSYSIVNREGQRPVAPQDLSGGLSTPRFLRLDF